MKHDKNIKECICYIGKACNDYLSFTAELNECATTDRVIEDIIYNLKRLEELYNKNFDFSKKRKIDRVR